MSPWLFNIFFDRVVRQVNESPTRTGVKLGDENQRESCEKVRVSGDEMQEVDKFIYL